MDNFLADAEKKVKKKAAAYKVKPKKDKSKGTVPEPKGSIWDYFKRERPFLSQVVSTIKL